MSDETNEARELAAADDALVGALRVGDAETALAWASTRNELLERISRRALAGVATARERLAAAGAVTEQLLLLATAERAQVAAELGAVRTGRQLRERVQPARRDEPRFVSRRA